MSNFGTPHKFAQEHMSPKFCVLPLNAFLDKRITLATIRVLGVLSSYADKNRQCYPSQSTVAEQLGVSRQAVNFQVKRLKKLGYLEVTRRKDEKSGRETSCLYRIVYAENDNTPATPEDAPYATPASCIPCNPKELHRLQHSDVAQTDNLKIQMEIANDDEVEEVVEASSTSSEEFSTHNNHEKQDAQGDQGLLPGNHSWTGIYPETMTEAQQNRHIQVYKRVTGKMPLVGNYKMVVDAIMQLRETYPSDDDLVEYLTPLWSRWKDSKRKDGRSYSQNNPAWLAEWALDGLNENEQDEHVSTRGVNVIKNPTPAQRARAMPTALPEPPRRS